MMQRLYSRSTHARGFTLIELLVVIAIIGILSAVVLASLNAARARARDASRVSDVREMVKLMNLETGASANALEGCNTAGGTDVTTDCTGPGEISQFSNFSDPSGASAACTNASTDDCAYSINAASSTGAPTTEDYEICFRLEEGAGDLGEGMNSAVGPAGNFSGGCGF